jgi:hypothetical protein
MRIRGRGTISICPTLVSTLRTHGRTWDNLFESLVNHRFSYARLQQLPGLLGD